MLLRRDVVSRLSPSSTEVTTSALCKGAWDNHHTLYYARRRDPQAEGKIQAEASLLKPAFLPRKGEEDDELAKEPSRNKLIAYLPFMTVAATTFSGGEEIGIYTSVFATNNDVPEIIVIISIVMILTAVWCGMAAYLVNHSFLANRLRRISSKVLPFVLIGLGLYILAEAFLVPQ
jgi:hypothetical protein